MDVSGRGPRPSPSPALRTPLGTRRRGAGAREGRQPLGSPQGLSGGGEGGALNIPITQPKFPAPCLASIFAFKKSCLFSPTSELAIKKIGCKRRPERRMLHHIPGVGGSGEFWGEGISDTPQQFCNFVWRNSALRGSWRRVFRWQRAARVGAAPQPPARCPPLPVLASAPRGRDLLRDGIINN